MADTSNLSNFLGDVADAIRTKKGTTETIPAANFDTEIASIETGADTSDATATADDILQGTTAYIADGKAEGNIQKIEEVISGSVKTTSKTIIPSTVYGYCARHDLMVANIVVDGSSYPRVTFLNNNELYSNILSNTAYGYYFGKIDETDGTVVVSYINYGGHICALTVNTQTAQLVSTITDVYLPCQDSYDHFVHIPDASNPRKFYAVSRNNADNTKCSIYKISGNSYELLLNVDVGTLFDGGWAAYKDMDIQYNPSNNKLLIQCGNYRNYRSKRRVLIIYDIVSNTADVKLWDEPEKSTFNYNYLPYTWYNDEYLLYCNKIQKLENNELVDVGVIENMSSTEEPRNALRYGNLVVKRLSGSIVAQSIDFENNIVIDEKVVCDDYPTITLYDGGVFFVKGTTVNGSVVRDMYKVELSGDKVITKLVRKGKSYIDTSKGTITSGDILEGKIAYSNGNKLTGAMPNNGELNITPSKEPQSIPAGYTSGGTVGAIDYSNTLSPTEYDNCLQLSNSILNGTKPYVELAYIESSGTQYINTEYKAGINTKIMMSVMTTDSRISSGLFVQITGAKNSYHSSSAIQVAHGLNDNMVIIDYGTGGSNNQQIIPRNTKIDIIVGNNVSSVNGQMYSQTGSFSGTCSYPLWIFDCNDAGSHEQYYIGRVYYYKIYENDTLVRDFIPVKNILNNEICLYDKIESKFYYNSGSGNFIGGGN